MISKRSSREPVHALIKTAREGGITLVIGAGVSIPRGIPKWDELAALVWKRVFNKEFPPWKASGRNSQPAMPQLLPIVFELAYREKGEAEFIQVLREYLYARASDPAAVRGFGKSMESLAVLARLIVKEHKRKQGCRIDAIITFNADDFIEQAVGAMADSAGARRDVVRPIARSTHFPLNWSGSRSIPVYHIHGFVPSAMGKIGSIYEHMLVFTDAQYWSTSAGSISFANRIMASALSEGQCVFVGLSMTDINLLRWLALRALEKDRDELEGKTRAAWVGRGFTGNLQRQFTRHFWIRPDSDDPSGFLSEFLALRGVQPVAIDSWNGNSLARLLKRCFP